MRKTTKDGWSKMLFVGMTVMSLMFGLVLSGCGTLSNLLNPKHVIDKNGNNISATFNSLTSQYTIEGIAYSYMNRPAVPAAPKKPISPSKPNPPSKPTEPTGRASYQLSGGGMGAVTWSTGEELRKILQEYSRKLDENSRTALQSEYDEYVREVNNYNANLSSYKDKIAKYDQAVAKYQQDNEKYQRDFSEYQSHLPEYQAKANAEAKSIQNKINQNAPENWVAYIDGKYLIYNGKASK